MSRLVVTSVAQQPKAAPHPKAAQHSGTTMLPLEIILVLIGVAIGRLWGKRAGLKHLGQSEYRSRLSAARKIRRW